MNIKLKTIALLKIVSEYKRRIENMCFQQPINMEQFRKGKRNFLKKFASPESLLIIIIDVCSG